MRDALRQSGPLWKVRNISCASATPPSLLHTLVSCLPLFPYSADNTAQQSHQQLMWRNGVGAESWGKARQQQARTSVAASALQGAPCAARVPDARGRPGTRALPSRSASSAAVRARRRLTASATCPTLVRSERVRPSSLEPTSKKNTDYLHCVLHNAHLQASPRAGANQTQFNLIAAAVEAAGSWRRGCEIASFAPRAPCRLPRAAAASRQPGSAAQLHLYQPPPPRAAGRAARAAG